MLRIRYTQQPFYSMQIFYTCKNPSHSKCVQKNLQCNIKFFLFMFDFISNMMWILLYHHLVCVCVYTNSISCGLISNKKWCCDFLRFATYRRTLVWTYHFVHRKKILSQNHMHVGSLISKYFYTNTRVHCKHCQYFRKKKS